MGMNEVVRAAGGIVFREGPKGLKVLLVHRPRYDDWTFPKGKRQSGESDDDCARREVREETGLVCELKKELSSVSYTDRKGRPKVVRYWAMKPNGGSFVPNREVDKARWLALADAPALLSYHHDRELVEELVAEKKLWDDPILLVRHAAAGHREKWEGDDRLRPLDRRGKRQAKSLISLLQGYNVGRIVSSPYVRCVETVKPLARVLGLEIEVREELAEGAGQTATGFLGQIAGSAPVADSVLCTHGDVIADLIGDDREAKKGSVWVLEPGEEGLAPSKYLTPIE